MLPMLISGSEVKYRSRKLCLFLQSGGFVKEDSRHYAGDITRETERHRAGAIPIPVQAAAIRISGQGNP